MAGAKVRDKAVIEHIPHPIEAVHGCRYCWMCRHVCPVGHVTHRETHTPHAWALSDPTNTVPARVSRAATAPLSQTACSGANR